MRVGCFKRLDSDLIIEDEAQPYGVYRDVFVDIKLLPL